MPADREPRPENHPPGPPNREFRPGKGALTRPSARSMRPASAHPAIPASRHSARHWRKRGKSLRFRPPTNGDARSGKPRSRSCCKRQRPLAGSSSPSSNGGRRTRSYFSRTCGPSAPTGASTSRVPPSIGPRRPHPKRRRSGSSFGEAFENGPPLRHDPGSADRFCKGRIGGEASHVVLLVPEERVERVHALEVEPDVVLVGDADAAMELQ